MDASSWLHDNTWIVDQDTTLAPEDIPWNPTDWQEFNLSLLESLPCGAFLALGPPPLFPLPPPPLPDFFDVRPASSKELAAREECELCGWAFGLEPLPFFINAGLLPDEIWLSLLAVVIVAGVLGGIYLALHLRRQSRSFFSSRSVIKLRIPRIFKKRGSSPSDTGRENMGCIAPWVFGNHQDSSIDGSSDNNSTYSHYEKLHSNISTIYTEPNHHINELFYNVSFHQTKTSRLESRRFLQQMTAQSLYQCTLGTSLETGAGNVCMCILCQDNVKSSRNHHRKRQRKKHQSGTPVDDALSAASVEVSTISSQVSTSDSDNPVPNHSPTLSRFSDSDTSVTKMKKFPYSTPDYFELQRECSPRVSRQSPRRGSKNRRPSNSWKNREEPHIYEDWCNVRF